MLSFCGSVVVEHVVRNVSKCCHVNCLHTHLTHCMLGNFMVLIFICDVFAKLNFLK